MSLVSQLVTIILSFVSRTVFIHSLGAEYLGLNGLFTNILSVLSLAELGISSAIIYSLYQPIKYGDHDRIAGIINYYKKLYRTIAIIVACVGLVVYPFLDFFLTLESPIPHVKEYYLIYLVQTVSSYLIVYRTSILSADQKEYIISRTQMCCNTLATLLQMLMLILTKNYALYLAVQIFFAVMGNYINSRIARKRYPYICNQVEITVEEKNGLWVNIKSMFIYKIGGVILNNTSNLLISKLVSTAILGLYSNYTLIITKASGILSLVFVSMQASLGNMNVDDSKEHRYMIFKVISLIEFWVYSIVTITFCVLINDFIKMWLSDQYVLPQIVVYICGLNFYLQGVLYPVWCYRNTTGLFKDTKYVMLLAAAINLILAIFLGQHLGLPGILMAPAIARLTTNIWYEPLLLFKKYLERSVLKYYFEEFLRALFIIVFVFGVNKIFSVLMIESTLLSSLVKLIVCVLIPSLLYSIIYRNTVEFQYLWSKISGLPSRKSIETH